MATLSRLPEPAKRALRPARDAFVKLSYRGEGRLCPVCGRSSRRFRDFGVNRSARRADAECVYCGALERHRLVWLFLQRKTDLLDGMPKEVLHVAPERCFERRFRDLLGKGYVTADLAAGRAAIQMDVADIPYPDESFDVIYCSHVLEHVQDDRQAIREFFRVLREKGWAILLVPIEGKTTFEDPSAVDPGDRLRLFGQEDHVRLYGADYADRLRESGFHVDVVTVADLVDARTATQMGLTAAAGDIYFCTKPTGCSSPTTAKAGSLP